MEICRIELGFKWVRLIW
jgi:hypothetical protein